MSASRDTAARARAVAADLGPAIAGEVRNDEMSRALYSTGACMYRVPPVAVVFPKDRGDVVTTVRYAAERGIPIIARGGGSSRVGQALGAGIVLDFTRHMDRILEIDPQGSRARVQPGVVLNAFTQALLPHRKYFPPDPSSGEVCTLGGMLANNAKGSHSVKYGPTRNYVESLEVVLASGDIVRFEPFAEGGAAAVAWCEHPLSGGILRGVLNVLEQYGLEMQARAPEVTNNNCGYNLWGVRANGRLDLTQLLVGSEGTLGVFTEATLRLIGQPRHRLLALLTFGSLEKMGEAVAVLREQQPSMIEVIERTLLDVSREADPDLRAFLPAALEAVLLLEHEGDNPDEVRGRMEESRRRVVEGLGLAEDMILATDAASRTELVAVRKAAGSALREVQGGRRPVAFIEDAAVHPSRLPEFITGVRALLKQYDVVAAIYGHAGDGNLHIMPCLNMRDSRDIAKIRSFAEECHQLVWRLHGTISAEHGDGLARTGFIRDQYGDLAKAFAKVKACFDPRGLLNPGKIVGDDPDLVVKHLRYGEAYRTVSVTPVQAFRSETFAQAVERCTGVGRCRKQDEATMCPSYMATLDEEHSTRGRANALRAVLSGTLPPSALTGHRLYETLDLCLECKACKSECPQGVDMAKLKSEFLAAYHHEHGVPLRARLFAHAWTLGKFGSRLAPLSNWLLAFPLTRLALHHLGGVDRRRRLPPFARPTFSQWFRTRGPSPPGRRGQVALFADTFMTFHYPEVGRAATKLLERAGFQVLLAEAGCCGRPMISKGLLESAREQARENVRRLHRYVEAHIPIVGCEPSCLLTFREEYRELVDGPEAEGVARGSFLLEEFLNQLAEEGALDLHFAPGARRVLLHGHCHLKASVGTGPVVELLRRVPELTITDVDAGCCGMAGSFGFEREHYELSMAIGARRLFPAVESAGPETVIVAPGVSCRQQIAQGTARWAGHPAEVLAEWMVG
ncbi:MAG: FAD-binding and (Fe-S)-binding domain-containing protein [Candidatus Methylomirabilales bacterium]